MKKKEKNVSKIFIQENFFPLTTYNEIVHQIQADGFDYLDFPVMKIAGKDVPLAYSKVLEDESIPTSKEIVEKILANF